MELPQLQALVAVADTGAFERAGTRLSISTSAVSQRIKALERSCGTVLVRRGAPCAVTDAGALVLRYARQIDLLVADLRRELAPTTAAATDLHVAVNADSLATWFPLLFAEAAGWHDVRLQLHVDDEEHTGRLLTEGVVVAAVTTVGTPPAGCVAEPLGTMRYVPLVREALLRTHNGRGVPDLERLPVVRFDEKDELQHRALREAGIHVDPPTVRVPSPTAFADAVRAGLGWGMVPGVRPDGRGAGADLVPVPGLRPVDRRLYWQRWKLGGSGVQRLTGAVRRAFTAGA